MSGINNRGSGMGRCGNAGRRESKEKRRVLVVI